MARILCINNGPEKERFVGFLQKAIQSANLNFLIGSGCSAPVIPTLGNVEQKIQGFIDAKKIDDADKETFEYLKHFLTSFAKLDSAAADKDLKSVLDNYTFFLKVIGQCLSKRENNILPKQATIFSTNYDIFVEKAFEKLAMQVNLNDGFSRIPLLSSRFLFSPSEFFNSVFNNGNLYNYQVEIPSINLIKIHGSLSWKAEGKEITFATDWIKTAIADCKSIVDSKNFTTVKDFNQKFTVVLPRADKFKDAILNQTYYDLLRIYANQLDKENTILIVLGFSFSDEHILEITKRALKNPTLRVVIFCYKPSEKDAFAEKFLPFNNVDLVCSEDGDMGFADACLVMQQVLPVEIVSSKGIKQDGQ